MQARSAIAGVRAPARVRRAQRAGSDGCGAWRRARTRGAIAATGLRAGWARYTRRPG